MRIQYVVRRLLAFTVLFLGLSAPVVHGHGGDPDMVHACVNKASGTVKFVGPNEACKHNETAVDWDKPSRTFPSTFNVDCDAGQTIGAALGNLIPEDLLLVSGTCHENLVIREELNRVILDGRGRPTMMAKISGPDPALDTVDIRGRDITIRGFVITGGNNGVGVKRGGTATIDGNLIQNAAASHGILVSTSFAVIVNNTIENNAAHGIQINLSGAANIGFRRATDAAASPNVIRKNGNIGINVTESSSARIDANTITSNVNAGINVGENATARIGFSSGLTGGFAAGNTVQYNGNNGIRVYDSGFVAVEGNVIANNVNAGISIDTGSSAEIGVKGFINTIDNNNGGGIMVSRSSSARIQGALIRTNTGNGVQLRRASQADIGSNTIAGNTLDGIRLEENSGLNIFPAANTGANVQFGVRCLTGGYAIGSIGGLNGTGGQKNFGITVALTENPAVSVNSEGCIDRTSP